MEERKNKRKGKPFGLAGFAISGLLAGAALGGVGQFTFAQHGSLIPVGFGAALGLLAGMLTGVLVVRRAERVRMMAQYAIVGLFPGFFIVGNPYVWPGKEGVVLGAILGAFVFGLVIAPLLHRLKERGNYLSYPGEGVMLTVLGMLLSYAGDELAGQMAQKWFYVSKKIGFDVPGFGGFLKKASVVWIPKKGMGIVAAKVAFGSLFPLLLVLAGSLWIGFVLAFNRRRPVFGASLAAMGGGLVGWIGIKVAPMLFLPGSGLMWAGLVVGLLMVALALTAVFYTPMRVPIGVVIIVLSILSFVGAAGGMIVGGLLGIFGGALIASWNGPVPTNEIERPEIPPRPMTPENNIPL